VSGLAKFQPNNTTITMDWFKENSAAIQAFSSLGTLLATIGLAFLTGFYVHLTRKISQSSHEQLWHLRQSIRDEQRQYACALGLFVFRLREALGHLNDTPIPTELQESFFLKEGDITELRVLARKVNGKATDFAIQAVMSLRVLYAIIQKAKEEHVNEKISGQPTDQRKKAWRQARSDSERALLALQEECGRIAGIDVNTLTTRA
jgi:hypothetical protein